MRRRGNRGTITPAILLFLAAGLYLSYRSWAVTGAVLAPPPVASLPPAMEGVASVDLAEARDRILSGVEAPVRDPFHAPPAPRRPRPKPKPTPEPVVVEAPLPTLKMILVDQVSPEVQFAVAGVSSGRLRIGQTFRGWTVLSITSRTCVVEKEGSTHTLSLPTRRGS